MNALIVIAVIAGTILFCFFACALLAAFPYEEDDDGFHEAKR